MRIAIVDDDHISRTVLRTFLGRSGHTLVGEAATGEEGLRIVVQFHPDLLLLDLELPDIHGVEVARRLADLMPTPVVVISAQDEETLFARAMEAGIHAYLTKPFNAPDLARAIAIARARFEDAMSIRRLQQAAELKVARLALAHEVVQRLGRMNLSDAAAQRTLLQDVAGRIQQGFGYQSVSIALVADGGFDLVASVGADAEQGLHQEGARRALGGVFERVADEGQSPPTPATEPTSGDRPAGRGELVIPMKLRGRVIGVLHVQGSEPAGLGTEDLEVMGLLAGSMAAILENARLVDDLQAQGRKLAETNEQLMRAQAQLVKTERLAAIGQTVAAIQHEINNPLTSVLGNIQWLRRREGFSPEASELLNVIEREADRIRVVLQRLQSAQDRLTPYIGETQMIDLGAGGSMARSEAAAEPPAREGASE